ncbi:MAG: SHOCT domain-containing protein [Ornithinimicrobium sp.]
MSFFEAVWLIVISFAFIAYLMAMFTIITDLFRDKSVSGGMKAVWFVCLIIFPLLTALIYLVVRGGGMAERSAKDMESMRAAQEGYIRDVAGSTSPSEQIAQAKQLLDSGALSQEEFDALKAKALA